jgi:RNA polymerase sigma factor (sigma-70 family)
VSDHGRRSGVDAGNCELAHEVRRVGEVLTLLVGVDRGDDNVATSAGLLDPRHDVVEVLPGAGGLEHRAGPLPERLAEERQIVWVVELERERREVRELAEAITDLPDRQRDVVILRLVDGLSTKECAARLGIAEGTVKSSLSRGLDSLKPLLEDLRP